MDDGLDFSPLTDAEREAAEQQLAGDDEPDVAKPTLPSWDAEAPESAAAHLFGRPPDALWRYRTAEGAVAFCVCRWNKPDGGKEILPLCWFEAAGWQFKHWPAPRPLYNLDKIAANPDAPIVVCEGEKAADAAACIFPKSIATTSSGGANAAAKTDWTPLAGQPVCILPDGDKPGADYASEVAAILAEHGCDVSIIDAAALARIDPNGGAREPTKKGWDAADAVAEWTDIEALRKAAMVLAKPFPPEPVPTAEKPRLLVENTIRTERFRRCATSLPTLASCTIEACRCGSPSTRCRRVRSPT
jgi:putative DNA primase/helicase